MNLTDNFIYQNFKVIRDQIVNGVKKRKYLTDLEEGFPGCLTDQNMIDSLENWKEELGPAPKDSEIYNSIKTFLLLCENKPKDYKRYEGVSQSIKSLLRIVCLNNPTYLSYENYVYHITQSEVIIKFILSLFKLDEDESTYAFGGGWRYSCSYEAKFDTKRGDFLSRQLLIGHICGDALNSLLWCMRTHRNHFSHNSASDYSLKANTTKTNRKSELYTYIIDRSVSIERLKYLLIDYVTVFFFMLRNKNLKENYQETHNEVKGQNISLEFSIDDKIKDCKLTLTDPENRRCFNIANNETYDVTRFSEYRLDIVGKGESKSTNFKIDHTYTSNVRVTISVPPGQLDPFKPDITDLIDISYIPEYQMMKEIWDACAFESEMAEYIELAKNLTSKCFYTNKDDKIAIGKFKEEISEKIRQLHENIKQDLKPDLSETLSKVNAEIHTKIKEAIKGNHLEDACKQIEEAFSKLNYLKTADTQNHLTRNEQISEASRRFLEDGILDTSNTDNDRFIDEVNYMAILDAILDVGDLNMLYLMKDRLSSIISEKDRTVGLACEFHVKINAEKEKIRSDKGLSFNTGEAKDLKIVFVDQLSRMWNSENFAKFLSLRASYISSLLGHETSVKEIISDFMKNPGKNEFNKSLDNGTAKNLRMGLLKLKEGLEAMAPCPIIDAINKSGHHTPWCNHLIETEKKRLLATGFLRDYILLASDNLSEFDHTVLWILWDYLKVCFNIFSLRSVKDHESSPNLEPNPGLMLELDMLNVDIDRFKQDRDAWDAAVSKLEACFNEIYKSLTKASKRYSGNSCNIDSTLMSKINENFEKQLKQLKKTLTESEVLESIINLYSNSSSEVEKYKLFRDLYDLKEIGVASYPIALALRVIDANLPISWRTYARYRNVLYDNKDTFLNPDIFKRLEDRLKSEYILALSNFFKYPEERLRIVEMYEKCPDFKKIMSVEDFLIYLTMDLSLKPFVPEEVSRITAILNLTTKIDSLKGDAPSQTLKYTISKIKKSIESNALKLIDSKVNYIERTVREGSFLENIAAKLIPDTGPLDKLIDRWKIFGAHNMSIKSFNLKESRIFDNILEKLDLLYESGDRQLAGKYASELLPKLSLWTIYSSGTRVARFNKLEKFINEDDIPSYLTDWMEYIDGSIYLDRDGSLVKTLSGLEGIYRKYNDRIKRPHHYESAYSFAKSIRMCLEIARVRYRYPPQYDNV